MKVVYCWTEISGYMAACLRALQAVKEVQLHVIHLQLTDQPLPYTSDLLTGISNQFFSARTADIRSQIVEAVVSQKPDIIVLCGWFFRPYRFLPSCPNLRSSRFVLGMDTPWDGSVKQWLARLWLARLLSQMDKVIVAGERSAILARRLGVPNGKIMAGVYGCDFKAFRERGGRTLDDATEWPKRFVYLGRYAREKGLSVLVRAVGMYRQFVDDPWPLFCHGNGPEASLLQAQVGIYDEGYVQPDRLPAVLGQHGVFIMPSLREPWGVALAEAAAAGLPLICTDSCGASIDIVRPYYNGVIVPSSDAMALARAMQWMHENYERLRVLGLRGRGFAHAYSAEAWAERWYACFKEILNSDRQKVARR